MLVRRGLVVLIAMGMLATPGVARSKPVVLSEPMTVLQQGEIWGDAFPVEAPPAGQTPQTRADWLINQRQTLGRTPAAWVDWAKASFTPGTASAKPVSLSATTDLVKSVLKIYSLVGVKASLADVRAVTASAARLSPNVQGAFGELVSTVAGVYAAQVPTAKAVASRLEGGYDPLKPLLTVSERDATTARSAAISDAVSRFQAVTAGLLPTRTASSTPLFTDPEGLIILGGQGDDTYTRSGAIPDPVLLVDPSGNDTYQNSAGGACPVTPFNMLLCNTLVVSVVADLGTSDTPRRWPLPTSNKLYNDVYQYNGVPAPVQGAGGPGGIGLLVDAGGDDRYDSTMTRTAPEPFQYFDGGSQGFGFAGVGVLADGLGNDWWTNKVFSPQGYLTSNFGQGFGGGGGVGLALDGQGDDWWGSKAFGQPGSGFSGVYTQGTGFYGGVGIMADIGMGKDEYIGLADADSPDYYAHGFGAFGGLGILYEDGGDDYYEAVEVAHSTNPKINPVLNCAFGTASFGGVGVMIELGGNDVSYGSTSSPASSFVMDWGWGGPGPAYSAYVDYGGDDSYELVATAGHTARIAGWGLYEGNPSNGNTFGTFVDIGGEDIYIGHQFDPDGNGTEVLDEIGNNKVWAFGVDQSA